MYCLYFQIEPEGMPYFNNKGILKTAEWWGEYRSEIECVDKRKLYTDKVGKKVFKSEEKRKRKSSCAWTGRKT